VSPTVSSYEASNVVKTGLCKNKYINYTSLSFLSEFTEFAIYASLTYLDKGFVLLYSAMSIEVTDISTPKIACQNCQACCCRLEVFILTDTGIPEKYIARDKCGGETMARLEDGWCSALDRYTMKCTIYENRPWVCREFEMGSYECKTERYENGV
jgi:hypothetical protein